MGRAVILFFILGYSTKLFGQGLMEPPLIEPDSSMLYNEVLPNQGFTFPLLPNSFLFPLEEIQNVKIPTFDFNDYLFGKWKADYSYSFQPGNIGFNNHPGFINLFIHSGTVFNQSAYKLSDKFTLGGNSFAGKSIFSTPLPNVMNKNYDFRGASMFLQYKVSKNFKIETRVSVTNH